MHSVYVHFLMPVLITVLESVTALVVPHTVLFQPVLVWVGTYFLIMSQSLREQEERSVWAIN